MQSSYTISGRHGNGKWRGSYKGIVGWVGSGGSTCGRGGGDRDLVHCTGGGYSGDIDVSSQGGSLYWWV